MTKRDMIDDLVDIAYPLPPAPDEDADENERESHWTWSNQVEGERRKLEEALRNAEEHSDDPRFDVLLSQISAAHTEMRAAEERMRLLVAYGREFIKPQPYQLKDLAKATGMSISGTRSSYTVEEVATVARRIGRQPRFRDEDTSTD